MPRAYGQCPEPRGVDSLSARGGRRGLGRGGPFAQKQGSVPEKPLPSNLSLRENEIVMVQPSKSGGGPPHSKTLARVRCPTPREASWSAPVLWRFCRAAVCDKWGEGYEALGAHEVRGVLSPLLRRREREKTGVVRECAHHCLAQKELPRYSMPLRRHPSCVPPRNAFAPSVRPAPP